MKAVAFKRQNDMAVVDAPEPRAGSGEVVLKVHNCGICGSDLHACQYGIGMPPGSIMGHEFCGEVREIGPGVRGLKIGERVAGLLLSRVSLKDTQEVLLILCEDHRVCEGMP